MKKILFVLIGMLNFYCLNAQGILHLGITVLDNQGHAISGAKIRLKETSGSDYIDLVTNTMGKAATKIDRGKEWHLVINGFPTKKLIEALEEGEGSRNITETYDPQTAARLAKQIYTRQGFTKSVTSLSNATMPESGKSILVVEVLSRKNKPQVGVPVSIACVANKTLQTGTTNQAGKVFFTVLPGANYDVDIANILNLEHADIRNSPGYIMTVTAGYEPINFTEINVRDTITQDLKGQKMPPSGYHYFELTALRGGEPAPNETVMLAQLNSKYVFKAVTDENGIAKFMILQKYKYMIHMDYEYNIDVVDVTQAFGVSHGSKSINYRPDPRLEHPEEFIPTPDNLILKDYTSYKIKPLPPAQKRVDLFISSSGKINANSRETVLKIGVNGQAPKAVPKINIAFVLDKSGSMESESNIEKLKQSMAKCLARLPADAIVSVIAYDDKMQVVQEPVRVGVAAKNIAARINEISAGGGTSMLESMEKAYAFVNGKYIPGGLNLVVLMTDGWDSNESSVLENAQNPFNAKILCHTIGIGTSFNYNLLKSLSTHGNGNLFYVNSPGSWDSVFVREITGVFQPVASGVSMEVTYNPKMKFDHLYGYIPKVGADKKITIQLPDLYAGTNYVAMLKFLLDKPDASLEKDPVKVVIKYIDAETGKPASTEFKMKLEWSNDASTSEFNTDAEFKKLYTIAFLNDAIFNMAFLHKAGKDAEAQKAIEDAEKRARELYPKNTDADITVILKEVDLYLEAFKNLAKKKHNAQRKQ